MGEKIKIGIVGAGRRVHDMYAPVLKANPNIIVHGFWNRDKEKASKLQNAFGYKPYIHLDELARDCNALILAVNSSALTEVTTRCLGYKKPILVETPVWTREVVTIAQQSNVSFAIAEQTPYLPSEQFKMLLLKRQDVFGMPHTVINDNRTFEYHGLAQLRRYIGYDKQPIEVCGMSHSSPMAPFKDGNGVEQRGHIENWDNGQIRFDSGQVVVYNFSSLYNRCPYRKPRSLRIYTDRATISNDDNEFSIIVGQDDANHRHVPVTVTIDPVTRKTLSIEADVTQSNYPFDTVRWKAQTKHLTDQQEALKVIVDNFCDHVITSGGQKLIYDAQQGWTDFNLLMAIRSSSANKRYIHR